MKVLCFIIHGIGEHAPGYSRVLQEGVQSALNKAVEQRQAEITSATGAATLDPVSIVDFHEVTWSEIGSNDQANLLRKLYPEFFVRRGRIRRIFDAIRKWAPARNLAITLIGDVIGYLGQYQGRIKKKVFEDIRSPLEKAMGGTEPFSVVVVSHSLGTVIFHDLIAAFLEYRWGGFDKLVGATSVVTMGSPLSLFSLVAERANPDRFRRWTNFIHVRDTIAFPMAGSFKSVKDVVIKKIAVSPLTTHAAYWTHKKVHRAIADQILDHVVQKVSVTPGQLAPGPVPPEVFETSVGANARAGWSQHFTDFGEVPFEAQLESAKRIDVCKLYGGTWLNYKGAIIRAALQREEVDFRVYTLAPDIAGLSSLAHDFGEGTTAEELKARIDKGREAFIAAFNAARAESSKTGKKPGRLRIYESRNMINHSFYRFDDVIYYAPRPISSDKDAARPVPSMSYRRTDQAGNMFEWLMKDFEQAISDSRDSVLVFDSQAAPSAP